jgi:hypothetical protein
MSEADKLSTENKETQEKWYSSWFDNHILSYILYKERNYREKHKFSWII